MATQLRGVFTIPVTPFDALGDLDEPSLERDLARARQLHNRLIPLLNIEAMYGAAVYKEVLKRRGVIEHATLRGPGLVLLDGFDQQELDAILADVSELFTLAPLRASNGRVAA